MLENQLETNTVKIVGLVSEDKEFSHEMFGERFYNMIIGVPRLSESMDMLPITISERLLLNMDIKPGTYVIVKGQLRSYNRFIDSYNRLILTIFAREIEVVNEEDLEELKKRPNEIYLDGYICKNPVYRVTPFGREISDILLAVNRAYNKSDYIPSIAWGRNARFSESLVVGDHLRIWGRIQSREYQKKTSGDKSETRVAYEVSISKLEFVENDNNRQEIEE